VRLELAPVRTANQLGCNVEELLGRKVDCPVEKLGQVIGKKGKTIQALSNKSNVTLDVRRTDDEGKLHIIGPLASLDKAVLNLDRVISKTEEEVKLPEALVSYLTTRGVNKFAELRVSHPDVGFILQRNTDHAKLRGIPSDIEELKRELEAEKNSLVTEVLHVTSREAGSVVGSKGSVVEALVDSHQTAIQITRDSEDNSATTITIIGPSGHVESAKREIDELVRLNRETTEAVDVEEHVKTALLMSSGKGMQELVKKVNESLNDKTAGYVMLSFDGLSITVKGKARVLDASVEFLESELRYIDHNTVRIDFDSAVTPVLIGKGGSRVKEMRGESQVVLDFDRKRGQVILAGLDASEIEAVRLRVQETLSTNLVVRVDLQPYSKLVKLFFRYKAKEVGEVVHVVGDDDRQQIVLRGSEEKLSNAKKLVDDFLAENYIEQLNISDEDTRALLTGGKNSKIVELSKDTGVYLTTDREQPGLVFARGNKENVTKVLTNVRSYLFGDDDVLVERLALPSETMGSVIGKGGKTRKELETLYGVTISIHRNESVVTIRGKKEEALKCRLQIKKIASSTHLIRKLTLSEENAKAVIKTNYHRQVMKSVPVNVSVNGCEVTIRGIRDDVRHAVALLEKHLGKDYKTGYYLDESVFTRLNEAWKDQLSLSRLEAISRASISLEKKACALLFSGEVSQVCKAKTEAIKYMKFIFDDRFQCLQMGKSLGIALSKSGVFSEAAATSDAQIVIDRDLDLVLVFADSQNKVESGLGFIRSKIEEQQKLMHEIFLPSNEMWLISMVVGKGGSRIKALRKESDCRIDVDSKTGCISLIGETEEAVQCGKVAIEDLLEQARKECAYVKIPESDMAAFVGRSGSHVSEFTKTHGVDIQTQRPSMVRISGKEDAVSAAKAALNEWVAARKLRKDEEIASDTLTVRKNQIPKIIGPKGSTIREIQKDFRVKIDINRNDAVVTIQGERRAEALERIKVLLEGELSTASPDQAENRSQEDSVSTPEKASSIDSEIESSSQVPPEKTPEMSGASFPALTTKSGKSSPVTNSSPIWVAKTSSESTTSPSGSLHSQPAAIFAGNSNGIKSKAPPSSPQEVVSFIDEAAEKDARAKEASSEEWNAVVEEAWDTCSCESGELLRPRNIVKEISSSSS